MKKLAFAYAGEFNMPSLKMVKIEKENVMFANTTTGTVYQHNGSGNSFSLSTNPLDLAMDIELASNNEVGSAAV